MSTMYTLHIPEQLMAKMVDQIKTRKDCRSPRSRFNKTNGRHEETRTPDLYRVKVAL